VLAAIASLPENSVSAVAHENPLAGICILSGGTDGEDGPTDAAGALIDAESLAQARSFKLDAEDFLRRNDAYHYFEPLGTLLKTRPTHTNVCDVRVVVVGRISNPSVKFL
jgi:hydroxypyruvate reductase